MRRGDRRRQTRSTTTNHQQIAVNRRQSVVRHQKIPFVQISTGHPVVRRYPPARRRVQDVACSGSDGARGRVYPGCDEFIGNDLHGNEIRSYAVLLQRSDQAGSICMAGARRQPVPEGFGA